MERPRGELSAGTGDLVAAPLQEAGDLVATRLRRSLKRAAQAFIAATGPVCWAGQGRLLTLMYHRVLPAHHLDMPFVQPGMYVSPTTLWQHIRWLREHFELVDLQEWLDAVRDQRPVPRRACALTFDDGWLDNYEFAWPILRAAQAPATIFVVSSRVGSRYSFWPERLVRLVWRHADRLSLERLLAEPWRWLFDLDPVIFQQKRQSTRDGLDRLVQAAKRHADHEIEQRLALIEQQVGANCNNRGRDLAGWGELQEMTRSGLVRLGSHTRRHVRLREGLPADVLADEIIGSAREIEANTSVAPALFCYPNGERCAEAVRLVAGQYRAAVTTDRGWNGPVADPYQLKRIGLHEDIASERTAFIARLSGWL